MRKVHSTLRPLESGVAGVLARTYNVVNNQYLRVFEVVREGVLRTHNNIKCYVVSITL